jgi:hypothetical protein
MSVALRKRRWDNVVQWRGDNLKEVQDFLATTIRAYTAALSPDGVTLWIEGGPWDEVTSLYPTDWFAPNGCDLDYRRLKDADFENFYEREPDERDKRQA